MRSRVKFGYEGRNTLNAYIGSKDSLVSEGVVFEGKD